MATVGSASSSAKVFVARQPILDRTGRVFGYELLHRDSSAATIQRAIADERATAHVLTDGLLAIGFDALTGGRRALIHVSRQFLLDGIPSVLPPGSLVFGIGADVEADAEVLDACRQLRSAGYSLAVDHFLLSTGGELVGLADFVRISFVDAATTADRTRLLSAVPSTTSLIATKVESAERFQEAVTQGFHYFQGTFFGRP
jgi:c-di-GMP-related signal transduction protein